MTSTSTGAPLTTAGSTASAASRVLAVTGVVLAGAISGFFYAWVCSTMWGLDAADPRVAIAAMQAMNDSVRNAVFFPAFFLTPAVLGLAGALLHRSGRRSSARLFLAAAVVYFVGGFALTALVNVPMNRDLGEVIVPDSIDAAEQIWKDYSGRWQTFNQMRTVASFVALGLGAVGLTRIDRD